MSGHSQLFPSDSAYPPIPNPDNLPYGPGGASSPEGQSGISHPTTGPDSAQPLSAPTASTVMAETSLQNGQAISSEQVSQLGGGLEPSSSMSKSMAYSYTYVGSNAIQQWVLYNGYWTAGPSSVYYNDVMNTVVNNDQYQYIWSYEKYPGGFVDWQSWGYWTPGYHNTYFRGDMHGWHQVAIWGSNSGWSNVLWIYVW
jgi:hypothetical protein